MKTERRNQWLRGVLDLCVMASLADGQRYGYELAQGLAEAGLGEIKGGTLYPLLARLEKAGHVRTCWREGEQGPSRKYYELTADGRRHLEASSERWTDFASTVEILLNRKGKTE